MACKYFSLRKVNFSKCSQSIFSGARLAQRQEQWLFSCSQRCAQRRCNPALQSQAFLRQLCPAFTLLGHSPPDEPAQLVSLTALGPSLPEEPAQPASLTLHCHGAQSLGQGNHLCAHCYCKDLSFSCISLNKISHHIWWIISNSSSASLDLHEFILSGEIKRQFIHFLALLGAVILSSSNVATLSE